MTGLLTIVAMRLMVSLNRGASCAAKDGRGAMGGYGSTRWGGVRTRPSTDGALRLDVRKLAREGWLTPGAVCTTTWTRRGETTGTIRVLAEVGAVILDYRRRGEGEANWQPVRERIALAATACTLGGERVWFVCPGCGRRRAVLYGDGLFRCRACHGLAYPSTRERADDRLFRRRDALADKVGSYRGRSAIAFPPKPPRMRWRTYRRLRAEWDSIEQALDNAFQARFG